MKAIITSFLIIIGITLGNVAPSFSQSSEQLFRKGLLKEEGEGNLNEAIVIYTKIAEDSSAERSLQAKALLQIGLCYEKMGGKQASKAYERIIEQYADQLKTAEIAKTRLLNINSQTTPQKSTISYNPIITQIPLEKNVQWNFDRSVQFDFSPDGKKFVYSGFPDEPGKYTRYGKILYVADVSGSPDYFLLDSTEFASEIYPRYSPDGKHIAFIGINEREFSGNEDFFTAIYVVNADGGKPKQISEKVKNKYITGSLVWHPNSEDVSYPTKEGIVSINLSGDITNTIANPVDGEIMLSEYSPDGKWVSIFTVSGYLNSRADCILVSTSGGKPIWLTQSAGYDGYGTWSEKDYSFYFVSNRNGDNNIFRIKIDPDTGEAIGDPEQVTHYYDTRVFSPKIIKGKSVLTYALLKATKQIVVPENENFDSYKTIAYGSFATLAPNGTTVYFTGVGKDNQGIYSIPRSGGIKKKLTDLVPCSGYSANSYCSISPDGSTLVFFTKKHEEMKELCFLSTENEKLFKSITIKTVENIQPDWSPDSKKVTYAYDGGLYTIPAWGDTAEKLAEIRYWEPWSIRWSPDGRYIAGFGFLDNETAKTILIVSTQNGVVRRLTTKEEDQNKEGLEWHPGSKKLAYMYWEPENDYDGLREAYVDGSPTTTFIDQPFVWDYVGKWDPTGTYYYFRGSHRSNWKTYKYNSKSKITSLFTDLDTPSLPCWSEDGTFMIFQSTKIETQLWMMKNFE